MIDHTYKELYEQTSIDKQTLITFDEGQLTNKDLYLNEIELKESLCSESELRFGACEASEIKFKIKNSVTSLKDKEIIVSQTLNGDTDNPFQFGKYKVFSDIVSGDRNYRNVIAYDAMYDIINADVTDWYESLEFPMIQKDFRDSFFVYLGIEQEEVTLIHDDLEIEKTITGTGISGKLIIVCICELNGVFGHINRLGNFVYISLESVKEDDEYSANTTKFEKYISCQYEDFETQKISKLQIRQETDDLGVISGDGTNSYIIENNFLVYGKEEADLQAIADTTLEKISVVTYRPYKAQRRGNPCFEVSDSIVFETKNGDVAGYILQRTLKGAQSFKDSFEANGVYEYKERVNSLKKDIQQLKGKSNVLERTLESTRSEITDIEAGLNTKIEQNTEKINASVQSIEKSVNESVESINGDIETLTKKVDATMTSEQVKLEIQSEVEKGASKVFTSTGYTLDDKGLTIEKSGSEMKTQITEDGMTVYKNEEAVLKANNKGVEAVNLHASTYLIIGKNSRLEDYGSGRTACYFIGGGA